MLAVYLRNAFWSRKPLTCRLNGLVGHTYCYLHWAKPLLVMLMGD